MFLRSILLHLRGTLASLVKFVIKLVVLSTRQCCKLLYFGAIVPQLLMLQYRIVSYFDKK